MSPKKRAIVTVINDLATDQRVHKSCMCLHDLGFEVLLIGRLLKNSLPLKSRPYKTHRMNLIFKKGILFYAEYQLRLFAYLLSQRADLILSNDLDTLLPSYLFSKIKGCEIIYDTHEYFCFVPELIEHPIKQKTWLKLEKFLFPKIKTILTVNDSIARQYEKEYGVKLHVVRNIPAKKSFQENTAIKTRKELGLPEDKKIILLQGSGINIDRGAEEAVEAMLSIENAVFLIIGDGDVLPILKKKVIDLNLEKKVLFFKKMPFHELINYTRAADIGLSIDKDNNPNYRFSLPNKFFDYMQAGIPVLISPLAELKKIMDEFEFGVCIDNHNPKHIADKLNAMLSNEIQIKKWRETAKLASEKYCWENESEKLTKIYQSFV